MLVQCRFYFSINYCIITNDCLKYSFFPSTSNDWFSLDINIRNSESILPFKSRLLSFICPVQNNIYNIFDPEGLKFLTWLRVGLSHLNAHTFHHNFQEFLNPLCSCSLETEDTAHYLLHCLHFSNQRIDLMNSVNSVVQNFELMSENNKTDLLLFCDSRFDENENKVILETTLAFIKKVWKIYWISIWIICFNSCFCPILNL